MLNIDSVIISASSAAQVTTSSSSVSAGSENGVQVTANITTGPDTEMGGIATQFVKGIQNSTHLTDAEKSQLIQYIAAMDAAVQLKEHYGQVATMIMVSNMVGQARGTVNKEAMSDEQVQTDYELGRAGFDKDKTKSYILSARLQTESLAYAMHGTSFAEVANQANLSIEQIS